MGTKQQLDQAIANETKLFEKHYRWLQEAMITTFLKEVSHEYMILITHTLMGFDRQDFFSTINLHNGAIVLCLDSPDADLRVLKNYSRHGIKNYQAFVSKIPPPFKNIKENLRVVIIDFTQAGSSDEPEPPRTKAKLKKLVKERNPKVTDEDFEDLIAGMNAKFRKLLSDETLSLALDMYFRAQTRDNCQYEVLYNENWDKEQTPSMEITLAWRNTPKHHFLYRLLRTIHRNNLVMKWVNATYINPYSKNSVLVMVIALHGSRGQAAWDAADIRTFLRELATVKYFASFDLIDQELVNTGVITGIMGNFLRAMVNFVHQVLVHIDPFLYTIENIEEALTRHPELTSQICQAFEKKFDPACVDLEAYHQLRQKFIRTVEKLDTGQEVNDTRRKNVLFQGMNLVHYCLKTNFFRTNFTSISFRLDPHYMDDVPFDRTEKFPKLPYAVFFIKGMHFFGFHIRFKDLARGGIRTVYPRQVEHTTWERNHVFTECYNLAFTQQKKNKDIPEGGAKGVIFLRPWDRLESETAILHKEFEESSLSRHEIDKRLENFQNEQQLEYMHHAQRSFIESLLPIVNCEPDGKIRTKYVIDYWERPEYLYLGPDENMHDEIIQWIAEQAIKYDYKPGGAFISSKPKAGMNHKEFGVTSLGVNVYMHETLKFLGIDPLKKVFTVKISGGPDGDVAGNQILNLQKYYPKTAKVLAITDISGTIFDPKGLNLDLLKQLVKKGQPIRFYPPEELNQGGFLLDLTRKKSSGTLSQQTLCWRKKKGGVTKEWLSGSDMNHLFRTNVHQTKTDIFIPAGGRPRTLHHSNVADFLDDLGVPTSKAIVEGANLYLTPKARHFLEEKGVLIIKDSSANKTGVICSSFEVLSGLTLGEHKFVQNKKQLVKEILKRLEECAFFEANLMLKTHHETGQHLTVISDKISEKINFFTYQLLDFLDTITLSKDPNDPLLKCFYNYCLPLLRKKYPKELMREIPDHHKKAIIACTIGSHVVYHKGIEWNPNICDILPLLIAEFK